MIRQTRRVLPRAFGLPCACLLLSCLLGFPNLAWSASDDWVLERRTTTFDGAAQLEVVNHHGNVTIRVWNEPGIEVIENLQRHRDDPRRWLLESDSAETDGEERLTITVKESVQEPQSGAGDGVPDPPPDSWRKRRVDLSVFVPASCALELETKLGDISGKNLRSVAIARSVGGSIKILTDHPVTAHSDYGDLEIFLDRADWDGTLRFETLTGKIDVHLPPHAVVEARLATSGRLSSDYSMDVEWSQDSFQKTARIASTAASTGVGDSDGAAGRRVELTSRRGDLGLLRSDSALVDERLAAAGPGEDSPDG